MPLKGIVLHGTVISTQIVHIDIKMSHIIQIFI